MRSHIVGLGILMLWFLGYLVPYTLIGFLEILLIISFFNLLLNKILKLDIRKSKQKKSAPTKIILTKQT